MIQSAASTDRTFPVAFVRDLYTPVSEVKRASWATMTRGLTTVQVGTKAGLAIVPGDIQQGDPRDKAHVKEISLLFLDVEAKCEMRDGVKVVVGPNPPPVETILTELQARNIKAIVYSTHSHTPENPRYRIVIEPARPLAPNEIRPSGLFVADMLGLSDCIDTSALEPARAFFLPRCDADKLNQFEAGDTDGKPLDVDKCLADAAIVTAAKQSALETRRTKSSGSVIETYNGAHDVGLLLEQDGYIPKGRNRWTYHGSTSGLPGVRLLDSGLIYSSHSNDPLNDGGAHDAFDVFRILTHGGDMSSAIKDAARICGIERIPEREITTPAYTMHTPGSLLSSPLVRDLVRGVLPHSGNAAIVGASMAGKGFLVFELMAVLAEGGFFFGRRTDRAPVCYVGLEGAGGLPKRIKAWEKHYGRKYPEIGIVLQALDLRNAIQVDAIIEAIRNAGLAGGVVIIDTLNQAAAGADENSSRDMGELIGALKHIQAALGGLVLVVHHLGKDASRGPRGHSSFLAALDAAIEVRREGDRREWLVAKAKDDTDGSAHSFRLQVVEVGTDEDGEPITSCVVVEDDSVKTALRSRNLPSGGNQRIVWDALGEMFRKAGDGRPANAPLDLPAGRPAIRLEDAVTGLRGRLTEVDPKRQKERITQAITALVGRNALTLRDGWLWCS